MMGDSGGLPGIPQAMAYVATVTLTVGLGLFLLPPYGQMPLAHQLALAATALALWSFSDGLFGRFSIPLALIEAVMVGRSSNVGVTFTSRGSLIRGGGPGGSPPPGR